MKKKILSLVLTACMVLSLLPGVSLPAAAVPLQEYVIEVDFDGAGNEQAVQYDTVRTASW